MGVINGPRLDARESEVRFTVVNGHGQDGRLRRKSAKTGNQKAHSIISSARASSAGGRMRLSAFAVFRLIRSWNLVA